MTAEKLRHEIKSLLDDVRNLNYFLQRADLETAFAKDPEAITALVRGSTICDDSKLRLHSFSSLRLMVRRHSLHELGVRELKDMASDLGIKGWSRMSKETLLSEIKRHDPRSASLV